jgi:uncharacterized protein YjbI with pentapeptide repeats
MRTPGVQAPRHDVIAPRDLSEGLDATDLLPGDALEGRAVGDLDVVGRDLTELDVEECSIGVLRADGADLRGLRVRDSTIGVVDSPVFRAPRSTWRGVRVDAGRIGSAELYDSALDDVRIVGAKLGFVNLRATTLRDVTFQDCVIDELDLGSADAERVAFPGCTIRELTAPGARFRDVDMRGASLDGITDAAQLRGAVLSPDQVAFMAEAFARAAGVIVD